MSSETEDGSRRRRRRKWSGKAAILTANQKRMVRKYLKNMFTTSVEGHHTYGHNQFIPNILALRFGGMPVLQMLARRGSVRSLQEHEI